MKHNTPLLVRPARWRGPLAAALLAVCVHSPARGEVAYLENFDAADGGYVVSGVSSWAWGTPSSGPGSARSGTGAWATNPDGDYAAEEDGYVTSPAIDLSHYSHHEFVLTWWQSLVTEANYDTARVEISRDGGGHWTTAYGDVSGSVSPAWSRQTARLEPAYAVTNFRVRFQLRSDDSVSAPGFYVDDVEVRALRIRSDTNAVFALYEQDFEADDGGFTVTGVSSWAWGTPTLGPGGAHSGVRAWGTGLEGFYGVNEDGYLTSPVIDLSSAAGKAITLSWWQYLVTEAGADFARVEVSRNGGGQWQTALGDVSGPVSQTWVNQSVTLDAIYAVTNFQVRFGLRSDESLNNFGCYVDDVQVSVVMDQLPVVRDVAVGANVNQPRWFEEAAFRTNFLSADPLVWFRIESMPAQGSLRLDGTPVALFTELLAVHLPRLTYVPNPNYVGTDSFRWNGADFLFYAPSNATVNVTVTAPPVAGADVAMVLQNTSLCVATADLLRNDSDPDGSPLRLTEVSASSAKEGQCQLFGGLVYYTPPPGFLGGDSFTYLVADAQGGTDTGRVTVVVAPADVRAVTGQTLNPVNGFFEQTVQVSNQLTGSLCGVMNAVRLVFEDLPGSGRVVNATGTNDAGLPFILHPNPLGPGQAANVFVQYFTTNRMAPTNVVFRTEVLPAEAPAGTPGTITIHRAMQRADGNFLMEFATDPGRTYAIQCSSDLVHWTSISTALAAPNRQLHWIDDYPPPALGIAAVHGPRFFRVILVPNP